MESNETTDGDLAGSLEKIRLNRLEAEVRLSTGDQEHRANAYLRGTKCVTASPAQTSSSGMLSVTFTFSDLKITKEGSYKFRAWLFQRGRPGHQDKKVTSPAVTPIFHCMERH
jgi:hypothetical protein